MPEYGLSSAGQALLDRTRAFFGANNVVVTSGNRSKERNSNIKGSSRTSQHIGGDAFDFKIKNGTVYLDPAIVQQRIIDGGLVFGQSIQETGAGMRPRNHLSVGSKREVLTGSDENARQYGRRYVKSAKDAQGQYRKNINGVLGERVGNVVSDGLLSASNGISKAGTVIVKTLSPIQNYITRFSIGFFGFVLIIGAIAIIVRKAK